MTSDSNKKSTDPETKASKTIVVKLGGSTLQVDANMKALTKQIAELAKQGHHIIVVHGGGPHYHSSERTRSELNFHRRAACHR